MRIKFLGINFCALVGCRKFRGYIFSWEVVFVDTLQLEPSLIINALLINMATAVQGAKSTSGYVYKKCIHLLEYPQLRLDYPVSWTYGKASHWATTTRVQGKNLATN